MYFIDLNLSHLKNVFVEDRTIEGEEVKCVCIPIEQNGLTVGYKSGVHIRGIMKESRPNPDGMTHYIIPYIRDKRLYAKLVKEGWWRTMFYLGKAKPYYGKNTYGTSLQNKVSIDDAMGRD